MKTKLADRYQHYQDLFGEGSGASIMPAIFRASAMTEDTVYLLKLSAGRMPAEEWRRWGAQRYLAARGFMPFLETAVTKAQASGLVKVAEELNRNLTEERGIKANGNPDSRGNHETWRRNFYAALGITEDDLQQAVALPSTIGYRTTQAAIRKDSDVWKHIGAFTALEFAIGMEMDMIEQGLTNTPELTQIFNKGHEAAVNRLYVSQHASHDLAQHFPALMRKIGRELESITGQDPEAFERDILPSITQGAQEIGEARTAFYNGLLYGGPV